MGQDWQRGKGAMMDAGRPMDNLISEHIMHDEKSLNTGRYIRRVGASIVSVPAPHYSTDIAAAWEVVDRFCALHGCAVKVERVQPVWERHGKRYAATVMGGNIGYERFDCTMSAGSNDSPAHALCLVLIEAAKHVVTDDAAPEQSAANVPPDVPQATITE